MPGSKFARARSAVLLLWCLLALVLLAWQLGPPVTVGSCAIVLATVLPMAFPIPGMLKTRRRSFRWAPLTLAPAMAWSLTELVANPLARLPAGLCALLGFLALAAVVAALRTMPLQR